MELESMQSERKLTQQEVADTLHVSVVTVNGHENNRVKPSYAQLLAYSKIYDVPVEIIDAETRD